MAGSFFSKYAAKSLTVADGRPPVAMLFAEPIDATTTRRGAETPDWDESLLEKPRHGVLSCD
jgi:hypothetical protein